jgi:hypothetical protein
MGNIIVSYNQSFDELYELKIQKENGNIIIFLLDISERGLEEHRIMVEDFKDISKLEVFVNLLLSNHNTAFNTYFAQRK